MSRQITDTLMMIRPVSFYMNEQTAVNNYYQKKIEGLSNEQVQDKALAEFDGFVAKLRTAGVNVEVFDDTPAPSTPDSIFPNNWVSFHESGKVWLYPMYAINRRLERREDLLESLSEKFEIESVDGFLDWEMDNKFLEGTGSLILDRQNKIAYAAISERTNPDVLAEFMEKTGYSSVSFIANQTVNGQRLPIYHTNVMMCLGESFAVLCADSIDDQEERQRVIDSLEKHHKEVVYITEEQKSRFAGNMLQVQNATGDKFVVMSEAAFTALTEEQKEQLSKHGQLLHSNLDTIEALGGGSARCMMAEVFLPKK
ncbi:citrulline utilization hydrolase CtlX [Marinoscillum pacificum]|uniref:citrulline utilization hydrolase CtlX n=1 Tax=Marinoscillum pacificum TaxID=392723 RepID=UPI002157A493|nr:arginine deiminase-related protein [Marinoscillum pacificum]